MKLIFSLLLLTLTYNAFGLECFEFKFRDFPDGSPIPNNEKKEIWCYQTLKHESFNKLIFNFDGKEITKNLAVLVENDRNFLFYDQLFGKIRVVEQRDSDFNPYQIPLTLSKVKNNQDIKKVSIQFTTEQEEEIKKIIHEMETAKRKLIDFSGRPGINSINDVIEDETVYLPLENLPTDGYWWPMKNTPMATPENSPSKIYDLYVKNKTGTDPKSTEWELANHSLDNVYWGGHCNGWVASSILYGFYDKSLIFKPNNSQQTITIEPYIIQGLRTETSFCVKNSFYGNRYRNMGDDPKDIKPDLFHKTIRYYLKELGKPLALDRIATDPVDNSIFSGYELVVDKLAENKYRVTAKMKTHYYSYSVVNIKKVATIKEIRYTYILFTDNNGVITGGQWDKDSPNPDFLWAPLAQMNCGRENPKMDPKYIDEMIETLPKGH